MTEEIKPHYHDFIIYVLFIIILIAGTIFLFSRNTAEQNQEKTDINKIQESTNQQSMAKYSKPPEMKIDTNKIYTAQMKTNFGDIEINLFTKETPLTVNNFVFLSEEGFYDGTIFHRIIKDFMIQGGDPLGTGQGGPGYKFDDEKITRDYKKGIVAMANSGSNTNGSQFFIMHKDIPLPKQYVIFGEVIKGLEVIDKIADIPTVDNGMGEKSKPTQEVKIEKITILEK